MECHIWVYYNSIKKQNSHLDITKIPENISNVITNSYNKYNSDNKKTVLCFKLHR